MGRAAKSRWDPRKVRRIYKALEAHFGDPGWWPAETDFEVIVGAVLTQNTAWTNVEKAIRAMKSEGLMTPGAVAACGNGRLGRTIRPAGYFRVKAGRLKAVCRFLIDECGGRLSRMKKQDAGSLRDKLLAVHGVGPETADSILIYALGKPVFVVDAYTRRVLSRHGIAHPDADYEELRTGVESAFGGDIRALARLHALFVETGKRFCRKKEGLCGECPLGRFLG